MQEHSDTQLATILVIDDEEMIRDLVRDILEMNGYTIICAKDGIEGIDTYRRNIDTVRCIILDLTMPRMGGKETYIKLREMNTAVKIVLSTGRSTDEKAQEIISLGVDGVVQKPYRMDELLKVVGEVVGV